MDRLGGFIHIFSTPSNEPTYQSTSAEIEPIEPNCPDEEMEDEEALQNQSQQSQPETKSFNFSGKNPSSMMSSLKSSNFFNFRGQQQQQPQQEEVTLATEATTEIDLEANNSNENVQEVPSKSKMHWKSFSGIIKAKQMLQNMRSNADQVETEGGSMSRCDVPSTDADDTSQNESCLVNEEERPGDGDLDMKNSNLNLNSSSGGGQVMTKELVKGSEAPVEHGDESWEVLSMGLKRTKLEFVTMDGGGSCCVCKARKSFHPHVEYPNEIAVDEFLAFTAGDVVLLWLPMDQDGFFQGELLNGKKGLVISDLAPQITQILHS